MTREKMIRAIGERAAEILRANPGMKHREAIKKARQELKGGDGK